nr:ATP-dependent 6-phosphofructokinase 5, chloroplastic [Tanacetum cinerariifolium]
ATRSGTVDNGLETSTVSEPEDLLDRALELGLTATKTPVSKEFSQGYPSDEDWNRYINNNDRVILKVHVDNFDIKLRIRWDKYKEAWCIAYLEKKILQMRIT